MSAMLRILAWTLALALVLLPVAAVLNGWIGADRWPLRTLRIGGDLQRVDAAKLRAAVLPYARSGFFAMRLDDAQRAVAQLPWVEHVEVRKRWPDVLEVRVVEHRPFARWGDDQLLSESGRLFPVAGVTPPKDLPRFDVDAPSTRIKDVVALYNESRELFAQDGRLVRVVSLDRRGSWSLVLTGGTEVVIGSQEARLRLARFARLLPQLLSRRPQPLSRADLRYTNGFALTWGEDSQASARHQGVCCEWERAAMHGRAARSEAYRVSPWMAATINTTVSAVIPSAARDLRSRDQSRSRSRSVAALVVTATGVDRRLRPTSAIPSRRRFTTAESWSSRIKYRRSTTSERWPSRITNHGSNA